MSPPRPAMPAAGGEGAGCGARGVPLCAVGLLGENRQSCPALQDLTPCFAPSLEVPKAGLDEALSMLV